MNSIRINIEGLKLKETQERVKNQIEGIVGVMDVSVSLDENFVEVNYDEQTSDQEINSHLQNNGYKIN